MMFASRLSSERLDIQDVTQVALHGVGEMFISQGEPEQLIIEGHPASLERVRTEIKDGLLVIRVEQRRLEQLRAAFSHIFDNWKLKYKLRIADLTTLDVSGAAIVRVHEMRATHFTLDLRGVSKVSLTRLIACRLDAVLRGAALAEISGSVEEQHVLARAAAQYAAPSLTSMRASVRVHGAASATVQVQDDLSADIYDSGVVKYLGAPNVRQHTSGVGTLLHIEA